MKQTIVTLDQVKEIENTFPTPFHIYDEAAIRENARALNEAFSWNKGYREYFAIKATPNPYILKYFRKRAVAWTARRSPNLCFQKLSGFKRTISCFHPTLRP